MRAFSTEDNPLSPTSSSSLDEKPDFLSNCKNADELFDYMTFLEYELERSKQQQNASQSKHKEEKQRLLERLEVALDKMDQAERELKAQKESDARLQNTVQQLRDECRRKERLLQDELRKEKNLEDRIQMLEMELQIKDDLINHRCKRDEKSKKQLQKENEILKKKATLGWMLGCLSEVYLQSELEGTAAPLLKMVRNIQRELERENVVLSYTNMPPQIQVEYIENEIHRLIECVRLADAEAEMSTCKLSDQTQTAKSGPSTQRSLPEDVDRTTISSGKTLAYGIEDNGNTGSTSKAVIPKLQDRHFLNPRIQEECGCPSTRYIINCFSGGSRNSMDGTVSNRIASENGLATVRDQYVSAANSAQIEMFEADPEAEVEHTRLSGSTWAEVNVMNKERAEAAEMMHCQSDIKHMLSRLELAMDHLMQHQRQLPQASLLPSPPSQQAVPQVQDRGLNDLDGMLLGAHAQKKRNKGVKGSGEVKRSVNKHGSVKKRKALSSKLKPPMKL
ncbi:hypothetical protein KP509_18G055200 [Ceratopteris richardii]|uniref:Uncharacterized protein n=1 Tax=Ceratopteris richardii TaxID=49495 RepID=A0A8T2ST07_CERRI|nr:hypothetical protein KP509_18G055200 [Ceratopteris richardii]